MTPLRSSFLTLSYYTWFLFTSRWYPHRERMIRFICFSYSFFDVPHPGIWLWLSKGSWNWEILALFMLTPSALSTVHPCNLRNVLHTLMQAFSLLFRFVKVVFRSALPCTKEAHAWGVLLIARLAFLAKLLILLLLSEQAPILSFYRDDKESIVWVCVDFNIVKSSV